MPRIMLARPSRSSVLAVSPGSPSRSATERDYKKERESRTAEGVDRESPPGLPEDRGEKRSLINALRRAVRESDLTPAEKRDMEAYLESLISTRQGSPAGEEAK